MEVRRSGDQTMRMWKRAFSFSIFLLALMRPSFLAAQDSAKQDIKDAGHETKDAAKDTGRATKKVAKKTGHAVKKTTKKAAHKTAAETKEGGQKVEDKTQPN